jgi:SAM-dependent MidA family methyltransferase
VVARGAGAEVQGPVTQGAFLSALGLFQRTERLAARRTPAEAAMLAAAAVRLAGPAAMGALFKVLSVCSPGAPALPGFPSAGAEGG